MTKVLVSCVRFILARGVRDLEEEMTFEVTPNFPARFSPIHRNQTL